MCHLPMLVAVKVKLSDRTSVPDRGVTRSAEMYAAMVADSVLYEGGPVPMMVEH
jgi:hypothetical protein